MVFAVFEFNVPKTLGFRTLNSTNAKNTSFFAFLCHRTQPIQSQGGGQGEHHVFLNRVLVDSHSDYLILSTRLLRQTCGIEQSVFYS